MIFKDTLNNDLFSSYIKQILVSTIKKGDILIRDNYSVHKVKNILDLIYEIGAKVIFLPPYSPDFNPIELAWDKIKTIIKN